MTLSAGITEMFFSGVMSPPPHFEMSLCCITRLYSLAFFFTVQETALLSLYQRLIYTFVNLGMCVCVCLFVCVFVYRKVVESKAF